VVQRPRVEPHPLRNRECGSPCHEECLPLKPYVVTTIGTLVEKGMADVLKDAMEHASWDGVHVG